MANQWKFGTIINTSKMAQQHSYQCIRLHVDMLQGMAEYVCHMAMKNKFCLFAQFLILDIFNFVPKTLFFVSYVPFCIKLQ